MNASISQNYSPGDADSPLAELVNIGMQERHKRRTFGFIMLGLSASLLYLFISLGVNHWWGVILWLPLFLGAIGILQCYHHT